MQAAQGQDTVTSATRNSCRHHVVPGLLEHTVSRCHVRKVLIAKRCSCRDTASGDGICCAQRFRLEKCADGDAGSQFAFHRVASACALAAHVTWSSTSCSHYWASSRGCCTHCTSSGPGPGVTPAAAHTTVRSCSTMWVAHVQAMRQATVAIVQQERLPFDTCFKLYIMSPWM